MVLFVHGWAGGGQQFFPMMKAADRCGFRAVSFDHFSHGESEHHESNLPLLVKATETVKTVVTGNNDPSVVVSHSLGCVPALNVFAKSHMPHVLISPVFNFQSALYTQIYKSGLPVLLLDQLLVDIEEEHRIRLATLDINDRIDDYPGKIELIHDQDDKYSDHQLSRDIASNAPKITLHSTNGLGHTAILGDIKTQTILTNLLDSV